MLMFRCWVCAKQPSMPKGMCAARLILLTRAWPTIWMSCRRISSYMFTAEADSGLPTPADFSHATVLTSGGWTICLPTGRKAAVNICGLLLLFSTLVMPVINFAQTIGAIIYRDRYRKLIHSSEEVLLPFCS